MTDLYSPTFNDEIRSVQRYLTWKFPDTVIRRSRIGDRLTTIILITHEVEANIDPHNNYMSVVTQPFVVYYNAETYDEAVDAREKFVLLGEQGMSWDAVNGVAVTPGVKRRCPLWQWQGTDETPPDEAAVMGYARILDVSTRVVEQEQPGRYLAIWDFTLGSYRMTFDDSQQPTLANIQLNNGGVNP